MQATLDLIRKMLPPDVLSRAWIAGSAAIAPRQASDIDVWVLDTPDATALREHAQKTWGGLACWHAGPSIPAVDDENAGGFSGAGASEFARKGIALVGQATPGGQDQPIQVLTIGYKTIDELLASFDLSCHAWAVPVETVSHLANWHALHYAIGATLPSELPRVLMWATPASTYARLYNACQRYGWTDPFTRHPDYARLLREIKARTMARVAA